MPDEEWDELIDRIRSLADRLNSGEVQIPDDLTQVNYAKKHLRLANKDVWKVINRLETIVFDAERDAIRTIAELAETNGESFAHRLRSLVEAGIVEIHTDIRRLRKEVT